MAKRSTRKVGKGTSAKPRAVPKSFCYPATLIDLRKGRLDWLFERPEPPGAKRVRWRTTEEVLRRIALIRVIGNCRRVDDPKRLLYSKVSTVRKLFLDRRPRVANPLREQPECQAACRRVHKAKSNQERILIYGDYDCDGATSVTLLYDALRAFGFRAAQIDCVIPDRLKDGYNLQWAVVKNGKRLKGSKWRPNLVIAVDCGTTATKAVETLVSKENHMDIIVLDHHDPDDENRLPEQPGVFHLNPKLWVGRPGWQPEHQMQNMCASGLAYLFAGSLLSGSPGRSKWKEARASLLAGLATCVDVMVLNGINRALLKRSLHFANRPSRLNLVPGLAALKREVGPHPKTGWFVTEETYGFYWGPSINAPGRMANAYYALKLLMTRNHATAGKLAAACVRFNRWRKATELAMTEEARGLAKDQLQRDNPPILTVSRPTWHPGVVGIVAARLRERYDRPAIVGSLLPRPTPADPDAVTWTGSGRSVKGGCDMGNLMHKAVRNQAITKGGGHPMAAGLSFSDAQRRKLAKSLGSLSGFDPGGYKPVVEIAVPASALPPNEWARAFQALRPFGNGNDCPALIVEAADLTKVRVRTRRVTTAQQQVYEADAHDGETVPGCEADAHDGEPVPDEECQSSEAGLSTVKPSYWAFSQSEITGLVPFLVRLRERSDAVSRYLREQLRARTAIALESWPYSNLPPEPSASSEEAGEAEEADADHPSPAQAGRLSSEGQADTEAEKLRFPLVHDLNRIITQQLYDPKRFDNIILRPLTRTLLRQNPTGPGLIQLNRLLLEDAYPLELKRQKIQAVPRVYAYEGEFEDLITGKSVIALWTELEQAEAMWEVHQFLKAAHARKALPKLPYLFRLQLEVRAFVSAPERSNIYRGRSFRWNYNFQIRQCIRRKRGPITDCRMAVVERKPGKGRLAAKGPS